MTAQHEWLKAIGKNLRGDDKNVAEEVLPRRWVDLIHYLDEQERKRVKRSQAETGQRRLPN
jgi:hypothetical protein